MKTLVTIFAVALALAFTAPAFAQDVSTAKTPDECVAAGGVWDVRSKRCQPPPIEMPKERQSY
jgi:hypothetical protein